MKRRPLPKGVKRSADDSPNATRQYQPGELGAALSRAEQTRETEAAGPAIEPPTRSLRRPALPPAAAPPLETRVDVAAGDGNSSSTSARTPATRFSQRPAVRMAALGLLCTALGATASSALIPRPDSAPSKARVHRAVAKPTAADPSPTGPGLAEHGTAMEANAMPIDARVDAGTDAEPITPARASELLASGHTGSAREAYRQLARRYPGRPVYAVLAGVLKDCQRTGTRLKERPQCRL